MKKVDLEWLADFGQDITVPHDSLRLEGRLSYAADALAKHLGADTTLVFVRNALASHESYGMSTSHVWGIVEGEQGQTALHGNNWSAETSSGYTSMAFPLKRDYGNDDETPFGFVYMGPRAKGNEPYTPQEVEVVKSALGYIRNGVAISLDAHDDLLGIPRRKELYHRIRREISQAPMKDYSILMIDLDNFKKVNDKYGHQIGDQVLQRVSQIISDSLKKNYLFARYGGEELSVFMPGRSLNTAKAFAEEIREKVESDSELGALLEEKDRQTISVGAYSTKASQKALSTLRSDRYFMQHFQKTQPGKHETDHNLITHSLIYNADMLLYQAKGEGRNRVCSPQ